MNKEPFLSVDLQIGDPPKELNIEISGLLFFALIVFISMTIYSIFYIVASLIN